MSAHPPIIDGRDRQAVLADLYRRIPGYTPEWSPAPGAASSAILRIFARYLEILIEGLNRAPDRGFLAFLDMLGMRLLPAQSARSPLVFQLMPNSPVDVTLPANSQVAAPAQPQPASPLLDDGTPADEPQPAIFATTQTITLTRARLAALYSVDPGSDAYADYTARLTSGFTLFDDLDPVEHALYLGHDEVFGLAGNADVRLSFALGASGQLSAQRDLGIAWDYLSKDGWLPLEVVEDHTAGFTQDGQILLSKSCGPDAKQETIFRHTSYWLRGRMTKRAPTATISAVAGATITVDAIGQFRNGDFVTTNRSNLARIIAIQGNQFILDQQLAGAAAGDLLRLADLPPALRPKDYDTGTLPTLDVVRARVSFAKGGLLPEAAFTDAITVDTSNNFMPFGQQPAPNTTFYVASKETFQRRGARVSIQVELAQVGVPDGAISLEWEYHNGTDWYLLDERFEFQDGTNKFTTSGSIAFVCPLDWREATVNGTKNFWLRVRIASGNYGHPLRLRTVPVDPNDATKGFKVEADPSNLQPPVVKKLVLQYIYQTDPELLDHCLTFNDFVFEDRSQECRWPRRTFAPFRALADQQPAVYFGFDRALPVGLVSLYLHVPDEVAENAAEAPAFVWEYHSARGWAQISVLDETLGFRSSGLIQFIGPRDAVSTPGLGGDLYRLRARLKQGERLRTAAIAGIWLNAVWATQRQAFQEDVLGNGDGNPGQTFRFLRQRVPVLEGEVVEVREWSGRGADWETAVQDVPQRDLRFKRDPATNAVVEVWARWHERPHLYESGPADRHYVIERSAGLLRVGDGSTGMIPPAGARVVASYSSGGGLAGNLPPGVIAELRTAVPYIMSATNPVAASGGAATELREAVRERGPEQIRHRDRAVAARDFEWLAREASPAVARTRCLPVTGPNGQVQRGWVTLVIVPHSVDAQPQPTPELLRRVREYIAARTPATVASRIRVGGPHYLPVSVVADIVPRRADEAAQVEARVRDRLSRFLHPLAGGLDGQGWAFGQSLYQSQIATIVETTPGVDYALRISLRVSGQVFDEQLPADPNVLIAAGDHELKLTLGEA